MTCVIESLHERVPWNRGKLIGQKAPLKLQDVRSIRIRLELSKSARDLALFNLALDSKLRACDLIELRVRDIFPGQQITSRAVLLQRRPRRPVHFEITGHTQEALLKWIEIAGRKRDDYLFPSRNSESPHLSTRQYARIVRSWIKAIGLDASKYGTHTLRRTKGSLIYRRTKNLRAVQLLLGHKKPGSTVRYLGREVDEALEMAEQTEA